MSIIRLFEKWLPQIQRSNLEIENLYFMLGLPILILLLAVVLQYSDIDVWWIAHFFDAERGIWLYKTHWLFDDVIHVGGQIFDKLIIALCLIGYVVIHLNKQLCFYRKLMLFFIVATLVGPIVVGIGKNLTHLYTPWDVHLFNGFYPYIRLFDPVAQDAPIGHAFPAGHASGGYCFLSLYFVLLHLKSPYRGLGLILGLVLGIIFGVAQQIRGAHFPSHDLVTLVICWYGSLIMYLLFYPRQNALLRLAYNDSEIQLGAIER